MTKLKFCIDCKHVNKNPSLNHWLCQRPVKRVDLVHGTMTELQNVACETERNSLTFFNDICGRSGRYWTPVDKRN
jgi:hypothetical protein